MSEEDVIEFLKSNLSIEVDEQTGFYNGVSVHVRLKLGEETLSEDWFNLASGDPDI